MPSLQQNLRITQFDAGDRDALLSFLREVYPDDPRKSDPAYWTWHFREMPLAAAGNTPVWVVKSGDDVVGQLATILVELKVDARVTPAIWVLDFIVRHDYRGQGLGKKLVRAARASYPTMITLGINEQSTAVFNKSNWKALGGIHRYQRLLFPGNALGVRSNAARRMMDLLATPLRRGTTSFVVPRGPEREVRDVTAFDASFDDLWRRASPQWRCAVVRDARYLTWQFVKQPGKTFDVLALYEKGELAGYVVLFFRKPRRGDGPAKASIADLLYAPDNAAALIDDLLGAALRRAVERRAGSLVADVLDPKVEERLERFGFWRIGKSPRFMASAAEDQDVIYEPANWFLTRGDSDVSIFEQPNL